jgi:kumamolisin
MIYHGVRIRRGVSLLTVTNTHVELPGSHRPPPQNAVRLGNVDPGAPEEVTLTLQGPALPPTHQLPVSALSRADIDRQWGVPAEAVSKVARVLQSYGLHVRGELQGGRSLRVSGTHAALQAAFEADCAIYAIPGQGRLRARTGNLKIPRELDGLVTGVFGIDQRQMSRRSGMAVTGDRGGETSASDSTAPPLKPADLERHYQFPRGDGAGQVIAVAEFGQDMGKGVMPPAFIASDIEAFCDSHGVSTPDVSIVRVGLTPLNQQQFERDVKQLPGEGGIQLVQETCEVMMDLQIIAALCPKASIVAYFASWSEGGWINLLDEVTSGGRATPSALSISYGLAEEAADWSRGAMTSINERLQIAAMMGITVCVSSGDDGSGCGRTDSRCHVEFPSSSPFVLSVGGTMLTTTEGGRSSETVWWTAPGKRTSKGGGATGGGVSTLNPRPAWQKPTVSSANPNAPDSRVLPDVCALAGPPFYAFLVDGKPLHSGGTSAATPLWAALIARINGALPPYKRQRFLTPLLYNPRVSREGFRDIVLGHNASHPHPGVGYVAAVGFDAVSGWGVPNGEGLLASLGSV